MKGLFKRNNREKSFSLKTHLWLYFCSFAVAVMLILWVLQIFLLSAFFKSMKIRELKKIGSEISEQYKLGEEDFDAYWFEHSHNIGVSAHIINEDGEIERNSNMMPQFNENKDRFDGRRKGPVGYVDGDYFNKFVEKISESGVNEVAYAEKNERINSTFAVYGAYIGESEGKKMYLYLNSPLERTDTTRKILQTQLAIATILSVLIALISAYFIARRLSKPIEKITESAHGLSKGNYDENFEHGSYCEINELADVLNYTAKELSKTEALRRDLMSNVSHDLKTPLTIIKSYAEMIRDISGSNEEKRNKHTGVIIDETNRLSVLVNDMLDLSRIQSGTEKMNFEHFDMNTALETITDSLEYYSEEKGYSFIVDADNDCTVYADRRKIEQVIYNLIANAVNYTGDDKKIYITLKKTDSAVRFSVRDTGSGIPADEINLVWEKYYKSSSTHKRQTVGSGIGLSIVKNILESHGAKFGLESEINKGSVFWFELGDGCDNLS